MRVPLAALAMLAPVASVAVPRMAQPSPTAPAAARTSADIVRHLDANQLDLLVSANGSIGLDTTRLAGGLWFPNRTTRTLLFASGLWVGAQVGGETRTTVAEYRSEYGAGTMTGPGTWSDPLDPRFVVYKVAAWNGNAQDTAHVTRPPAGTRDPLVHHAWSEYLNGAAPFGAPVRVWRLPNTATPDPSDSVDVPGPDVPGDQMVWCVYNDADPARHTAFSGRSAPLGIEVRQTAWTVHGPDPLQKSIFLRWNITNRGADTLSELRIGLWSDPDLGGSQDDDVGCDSARALGYVYNGLPSDAVYGNRPPAFGVTLLSGLPGSAGVSGCSAFRRVIGGAEPDSARESYLDLSALQRNGTPLVNPVSGLDTRYEVSGDPVAGTGWLDPNVTDKKMTVATGPGSLAPGQSVEIDGAFVVGQCTDALASIGSLRANVDYVRAAWSDGFSSLAPFSPCDSSFQMPPPDDVRFALVGFVRNPAVDGLTIAFSLPDDTPARLDVLDVSGRRVWSRDVGALGAGAHRLAVDVRLRPAVYFVRLAQGTRHATARGAVLR